MKILSIPQEQFWAPIIHVSRKKYIDQACFQLFAGMLNHEQIFRGFVIYRMINLGIRIGVHVVKVMTIKFVWKRGKKNKFMDLEMSVIETRMGDVKGNSDL